MGRICYKNRCEWNAVFPQLFLYLKHSYPWSYSSIFYRENLENVTPGYICAWIGILLAKGAHGFQNPNIYWIGQPNGMSVPWIHNTMPLNNFHLLWCYIHFVNNTNIVRRSQPTWDPLHKIRPIITTLERQFKMGWVLGEKISVDESMIKYMGQSITWIQYMPKNLSNMEYRFLQCVVLLLDICMHLKSIWERSILVLMDQLLVWSLGWLNLEVYNMLKLDESSILIIGIQVLDLWFIFG